MAMDLLRRIAGSPLPASFSSPDDIDKLRVLHTAGLFASGSTQPSQRQNYSAVQSLGIAQ